MHSYASTECSSKRLTCHRSWPPCQPCSPNRPCCGVQCSIFSQTKKCASSSSTCSLKSLPSTCSNARRVDRVRWHGELIIIDRMLLNNIKLYNSFIINSCLVLFIHMYCLLLIVQLYENKTKNMQAFIFKWILLKTRIYTTKNMDTILLLFIILKENRF